MAMSEDRIAVPVWDWPVRLVHWAIVLLLILLVITGLVGNEWLDWHMRFGEAMLALVIFRILWGFVGSRNARFRSFVRGPKAVRAYLRSFVRPPRAIHATHNPLGGWMVVALLLALLFQAGTGLFTNDDVLAEGPLAKKITKDLSDAISSLHRRGWWVILALAAAHITAVLAYLAVLRDNLVSPMVHGRKRLPQHAADPNAALASNLRAVILLVACGAAMWWLVKQF